MKTLKLFAGAAIAALCFYSCADKPELTLSGLDPQAFVSEYNGKTTALYTLTNKSGMEMCITNFGGRIVSLMVPDRDGNMVDVVLGFDNVNDYQTKPSDFGATIGRYANRIGRGCFQLDGVTYDLDKNDGPNCLHGGSKGWQYQVYDAEQVDDQTLVITMDSPDGEMGFPGNVKAVVTYRLTDDNTVDITYSATTDKPTVISMTNHAYFNLSGKHDVEGTDQLFYINADGFTPLDADLAATGEVLPVEGTPMDFRSPKTLAQDIDVEYEQLILADGYDHNWALNTNGDITKLAVSIYSPVTGIYLEEYTDQVGVQMYSGNFLTGEVPGKHGILYPKRAGACIETQMFPNALNIAHWPSPVIRPGETYTQHCIYKFSVR